METYWLKTDWSVHSYMYVTILGLSILGMWPLYPCIVYPRPWPKNVVAGCCCPGSQISINNCSYLNSRTALNSFLSQALSNTLPIYGSELSSLPHDGSSLSCCLLSIPGSILLLKLRSLPQDQFSPFIQPLGLGSPIGLVLSHGLGFLP